MISRTVAIGDSRLSEQIRRVASHLRLQVQLTLAPLYLWGVFGARGVWTGATVGTFFIFHVFLYGGTTLFNSYYDRDSGPIAGMERPPSLPGWALPFSVVWQLVGGLFTIAFGAWLALLYAAYAAVGILYSHPRVRIKARPYLSTVLIVIFQGLGGYLAGWIAGRPAAAPPLADTRFWVMGLVAATTILALYPLTQVYQLDEDASRGDRTLAMVLGPSRSFRFAQTVLACSAMAGLWAMAAMNRPADGMLLVAGYSVLIATISLIGRDFERSSVLVNFRRIVALQFAASMGLAMFVGLQFAHVF